MSLKPFQEKILEQLITQEKTLSKLYALFSEQFLQHKDFFTKMSMEEDRHAKLIEKLLEAAEKGIIFFDEGKIKTYTLTAFLSRLEELVEKAERGEFTPVTAFACAVDYESSLIEKKVFSHFDSLNEKSKGTLKILQSETLNHIERFRNAQKALKTA